MALKIRVLNEAESKEAQELLFEIGYKWADKGKVVLPMCGFEYIGIFPDGMSLGIGTGENHYKKVTIQSLRDTVVLKRNDVNDATHYDSSINENIRCRLIGDWWRCFTGGQWQSYCHVDSPRACYMVPIEKEQKPGVMMTKEYLIPNGDKYVYCKSVDRGQDDWVEVPEGADIYLKLIHSHAFYRNGFKETWMHSCSRWVPTDFKDETIKFFNSRPVLWKRQQQPEPLPFIDDEQSLNDQVATAEEYRREIKIVEEYDPVVRTLETYKVLTGITMDEQVARSFIAVYELAKQLKG